MDFSTRLQLEKKLQKAGWTPESTAKLSDAGLLKQIESYQRSGSLPHPGSLSDGVYTPENPPIDPEGENFRAHMNDLERKQSQDSSENKIKSDADMAIFNSHLDRIRIGANPDIARLIKQKDHVWDPSAGPAQWEAMRQKGTKLESELKDVMASDLAQTKEDAARKASEDDAAKAKDAAEGLVRIDKAARRHAETTVPQDVIDTVAGVEGLDPSSVIDADTGTLKPVGRKAFAWLEPSTPVGSVVPEERDPVTGLVTKKAEYKDPGESADLTAPDFDPANINQNGKLAIEGDEFFKKYPVGGTPEMEARASGYRKIAQDREDARQRAEERKAIAFARVKALMEGRKPLVNMDGSEAYPKDSGIVLPKN